MFNYDFEKIPNLSEIKINYPSYATSDLSLSILKNLCKCKD